MASNEEIMGVTLALGQTVSLWTVLTPPITEVRRHSPGNAPAFTDDVRQAEIVAGVLALTVGALMGYVTKSKQPFLAVAVLVGTMTLAYEYTLQCPGAHAEVSVINPDSEAM
jgi:hypothetical protein